MSGQDGDLKQLQMNHTITVPGKGSEPSLLYYLTPFWPLDKERIVELMQDVTIYNNTLLIPYPYSMSNAEWWLNFVQKEINEKGYFAQWAVRDDKGLFIGNIGFHDFHLGSSYKIELGYWLGKDFRGRGIMAAVIQHLCDYGFRELGIVRYSAIVFAFNESSMRVLSKAGFEKEGYLKKYYRKNDQYLDGVAFAKVKD